MAALGMATVTIYFEETFSLKDKRREVKSVVHRVQARFNCAIAEVADLDDLRVATLGVAVLSTAAPHADQMLQTIVAFIEASLDIGVVGEISTAIDPFDA
ncbi:MAG TPA: DUF503 domain-containing protein [Thermomicrobiales bacterium]|nr:DUF503 domain-containing protein [Thermomicrobiales bacterium]